MTDKITSKEIKEINGFHKMVVEAEKGTLEYALKAGALLKKAKDSVEHGQWLIWLGKNCPDIDERIAQSYMRLAMPKNETKIKQAAAANTKRVSDLSIREANKLIAPQKTQEQKDAARAKRDAAKAAKRGEVTDEAVKAYLQTLSADDLGDLLLEVFQDVDYLNSLVEHISGEEEAPTEGEGDEELRKVPPEVSQPTLNRRI